MFKKIEGIEIPGDDPFKNDTLEREGFADVVTNLIKTSSQPLVLSIDGTWGTGKTTFLKMWKGKLRKEGFFCLYFNSWENDFAEDPFLSFVSEIEGAISEDDSLKDKVKNRLANVKRFGGALLKTGIPIAVRLVSQGIFEWKIPDGTDVSKGISNALGKTVENRILENQQTKTTIRDFKDSLEKLAEGIYKEIESDSKQIIFFIDELDRCRPTYAIQLLENIKHLFDVRGFIFVLGIDRGQLSHSVKSIYGTGMDADGYLKRFIDLELPLPEPSAENYCKYVMDLFGLWEDVFSKRQDGNVSFDRIVGTLSNLSKIIKLSLRTINQCASQINIISRMIDSNFQMHPRFLVFLIVLKAYDANLYESLNKGDEGYTDIFNHIDGLSPRIYEEKFEPIWAEIKASIIFSYTFKNEKFPLSQALQTFQHNSKEYLAALNFQNQLVEQHIKNVFDKANEFKSSFQYGGGFNIQEYLEKYIPFIK